MTEKAIQPLTNIGSGWRLIRNSKGMTLIEIMIVLVILGGLIALVGKQVFQQRDKAAVRTAKIQISEVQKSVEMYYTDCGSYPTNEAGLKALLEAQTDCKNWGPEPYAKPGQLKDPWNNDLIYELQGNTYEIRSLGKDKKEGGSGYDTDITSKDL